MNPIYKQMIRSSVLGTLALVAMVFIPAGTLNYWQGPCAANAAINSPTAGPNTFIIDLDR